MQQAGNHTTAMYLLKSVMLPDIFVNSTKPHLC